MFMLSNRQTSYPNHWPVHIAGMQGAGTQGPGTHHTVAAGATTPAACQPAPDPFDGGGLAALPWLGLHYAADDV